MYDVLIIGGGPGGYTAALAAAKQGLRTVLFEKGNLGGTCLNVGCIPTKYLLDKAAAMEKVRALSSAGIFREAGAFSLKKIQAGKEQAVKRLVDGVGFLLKSNGVEAVAGEAKLAEPHKVICNGAEYEGKSVILATGSQAVRLPVEGADLAVDSTSMLCMQRVPKRLAVIGGGVIGLELASAFRSFGSEVSVIELLDSLLPGEMTEIGRALETELKKRGISLLLGSRVRRIQEVATGKSVQYERQGKEERLEADTVLMAVGRKANLCGIDAGALGLNLSRTGAVCVDENQRTNLKGVYAIGDLAGGYQLAHVAYDEAVRAVNHILGRHSTPASQKAVPRCVYTSPCVAAVGMTVQQAEASGFTPVVGTFYYQANGMALAEGAHGSVLAVMDKVTGRTLGFSIIGENAAELISTAAIAVEKAVTAEEWEEIIIAHPSLSEMLKEAALDAFGRALNRK